MNRNRKRRTELGISVLTVSLLLSACAVQGVAKNTSQESNFKMPETETETQPVSETAEKRVEGIPGQLQRY